MHSGVVTERVQALFEVGSNLRSAVADLLSQEFTYSSGHLTAVLNTCLFAPSILTFWFFNGLVDFSSALVLGSVASTAGLVVRLYAYLLVVPVFLLLRTGFHLAHPTHRKQVLSGVCPNTQVLSLDWFTVGILATGVPLALQDLGPWVAMNAVFFVGIFLLPRALPYRASLGVKFAALTVGIAVFLYAKYGDLLPVGLDPASVLGPVATLRLTDATTATLLGTVNSLAVGPVLVAAFGVAMNHLLTRPELRDIPLVRHTLPRRDPDTVVVVSAALGTAFYLFVVAGATGALVFIP